MGVGARTTTLAAPMAGHVIPLSEVEDQMFAKGLLGQGVALSLIHICTPLIELVTEPDLRTPEEARLFMEKLRRIFLTIGIRCV